MDKKQLSERDICTKFITPALRQAGWDELTQLREEVSFTKGRVIVRGKMVKRGKAKRADYILYYKPNIPLAVIEAKDNHCSVGDGLQQALEDADTLQLPFVFASNGDGFVFHDRAASGGPIERNLRLDEFPSPATLWAQYREWKGLPADAESLVLQDYYSDGTDKGPRYYQATAVNATIEAIARGQKRLLLVMATIPSNHPQPRGSRELFDARSVAIGTDHTEQRSLCAKWSRVSERMVFDVWYSASP
jgi:type I restriction enzyme R subunit